MCGKASDTSETDRLAGSASCVPVYVWLVNKGVMKNMSELICVAACYGNLKSLFVHGFQSTNDSFTVETVGGKENPFSASYGLYKKEEDEVCRSEVTAHGAAYVHARTGITDDPLPSNGPAPWTLTDLPDIRAAFPRDGKRERIASNTTSADDYHLSRCSVQEASSRSVIFHSIVFAFCGEKNTEQFNY